MEKDNIAGFKDMGTYPLLKALAKRRSRRIGLGMEITRGALKFQSKKRPVPLSEEETALLCFAGAGQTGLALGDTPSNNSMMTLCGRAFPSACNNQRTHLIFTNDDGVYLYEPRSNAKSIETAEDLKERLRDFSKDVIKIKDGRLELPLGKHAMQVANEPTVNRPGQTVFIPIVDPAAELINLALLGFQYEGWQFIEGETRETRRPMGIEKWIDRLNLKLKIPLATMEQNLLATCSLEAAFIGQNILLMAESMGLGAFPLGGFTAFIAMGGTPLTRGLGFRYVSDKKGRLNPVGIDGVLEGYCPPYWENMGSVVEAIVKQKFGEGGTFSEDAKDLPLKDAPSFTQGVDRIPQEVVECAKDFCNYVYEAYGRFPSNVDTMTMPLWVCAHHLDLDFYDSYYKAETINETQRKHMEKWH
ncbi:hypothetical protein ACFLUZ_00745 [Chloroflexota bacterium]